MGASWSMSQISSPINTDVEIEKNSNVPTTSQVSPRNLARSISNEKPPCDDQVPVVSEYNALEKSSEQFQTPPMYPPSEISDQNHRVRLLKPHKNCPNCFQLLQKNAPT